MSWRAKAGAFSASLVVSGMLLGPAAQAATPAQLTGTQLASRLLPLSAFPSGYTFVKHESYDSGGRLEHGPAKVHLATFSCQKYAVYGLPRTGFGETATAGSFVENFQVLDGYGLAVFQFTSPSQATAFYRQLYAITARCRTVNAFFHGPVKLTTQSLKKTMLGRLPAFRARQTLTAPATGYPFIHQDTLTTVSGNDVVAIAAAGKKKEPSSPALPAAVLKLVARVRA